MINAENLTPAQTKAIEAGGTNNAVIGGSLVKRGIFEKNEENLNGGHSFKFRMTREYAKFESEMQKLDSMDLMAYDPTEEKRFAEAMQREEDSTPTSESWEIENMNRAEREFAEAIEADDADAAAEILNETVPPVIVRDPHATRYEDIHKWTDARLDTQEEMLARRLTRRTLLGADRRLTESRLTRVRAEIAARGL